MVGKQREKSEDFKRDAVSLSYKSGKSMTEAADDLGINRSFLVRWFKEFEGFEERAFPDICLRKLRPLEEGNLRLKKMLADVKEDRDILKKRCTSSQENRSNMPSYRGTQRQATMGKMCHIFNFSRSCYY